MRRGSSMPPRPASRCRATGARSARSGSCWAIASPGGARLLDAQLIEHEGVIFRRFRIPAEAARLAAMTGFHVDAEHQRVRVGLAVAQPRHPLGGLKILD